MKGFFLKYAFLLTFVSITLLSCSHSDPKSTQISGDSIRANDSTVVKTETPTLLSKISIKGTWESNDNKIYPILEFKGKSTIVVMTFMGPFVSNYERDEEFIRVRTDKSDLLFEIVSEDSIKGFGFADGVWIKKV